MRKILVVDPSASIRRLVAAIFAGSYCVLEAVDAETGLGYVFADRPDVVLIELVLPDLAGLEFSRLVKGDPEVAATRILALTGSVDPQVRLRALRGGFDEFVAKPFRPSALRKQVDALFFDGTEGCCVSG